MHATTKITIKYYFFTVVKILYMYIYKDTFILKYLGKIFISIEVLQRQETQGFQELST